MLGNARRVEQLVPEEQVMTDFYTTPLEIYITSIENHELSL